MADANLKILLAEDDPFMTTLLAEGLKGAGFEPVFVSSGEDAVKRFSEIHPAAILLDILLPGKSGLEALADIRKLPGGAEVPALILSNIEETSYIREAERLNVFAYLIKANMQVSDITAKVKEAVEK